MDDVAIFIICVSVFAVAVLVLFAFFPIRVSWFYYRGKTGRRSDTPSPRTDRGLRQTNGAVPPLYLRGGFSRKNYARLEEDTFDDAEV